MYIKMHKNKWREGIFMMNHLIEELDKAINNFNSKLDEDDERYLDIYVIRDNFDDLSDPKVVQDIINQINAESEKL